MARFFATVPISEPTPQDFTQHEEMGGFAWDQDKGIFVCADQEIDQFILPLPRP